MAGVTFVDKFTLGECVPLAVTAQAGMDATVTAVLPELEARLAGAIEALAQITISLPSVEATIALLTAAIAAIEAAGSLPGASLSVGVMTDVVAELTAQVGSLEAQASVAAGIGVTLGIPGVWAYTYGGSPAAFGSAFTSEIAGGLPTSGDPALPIYAVVFVGSDAATISAMRTMFAV